MKYFYDESGNWQELNNERKIFVIGGLSVSDDNLLQELEQDLKLFKKNHRLKSIHATEFDLNKKEELYQIIDKFLLNDNVNVLLHYFSPKSLLSKTQIKADDLYIDIASQLISHMSFGDENIDIEYDMKFYYAYAEKVISDINITKRREIENMRESFSLKDEYLDSKANYIKDKVSKTLFKNSTNKVQDFYNILCTKSKLENKELIEDYLWTEFYLNMDKTNLIKDKFKNKIESLNKDIQKQYSLSLDNQKIFISYKGKFKQSAGVQVIDILCNRVYHNGSKAYDKSSNAVKSIYNKISIKDISHEI